MESQSLDKSDKLQSFVELIGQTVSNENSDDKDDNTIVTNLVQGAGRITEFISEDGFTLKATHLSRLESPPKKLYALIEMENKKIIKVPTNSLISSKTKIQEKEEPEKTTK